MTPLMDIETIPNENLITSKKIKKKNQNKHSNEFSKCPFQHNLQDINSSPSHPNAILTYLIPTLINDQITLGNNYEMEVTKKYYTKQK